MTENFGDRTISLNHPHKWSPRSPDLAPCDYFFWGYLKSEVYTTPPASLDINRFFKRNQVTYMEKTNLVSNEKENRLCQVLLDRNTVIVPRLSEVDDIIKYYYETYR